MPSSGWTAYPIKKSEGVSPPGNYAYVSTTTNLLQRKLAGLKSKYRKLLENWQNKFKQQAVAITVTGHGLPTQPSIVTIWSYWTDKELFAEMLKITIFTPLAHSPLSQHPKAAFSLCHSTYDAIKSLKALPSSIISTWGGNHRNPMLCYCWPGGKH